MVDGTPTILMIDASGQVTNAWIGRLDPGREKEVLSKVIWQAELFGTRDYNWRGNVGGS